MRKQTSNFVIWSLSIAKVDTGHLLLPAGSISNCVRPGLVNLKWTDNFEGAPFCLVTWCDLRLWLCLLDRVTSQIRSRAWYMSENNNVNLTLSWVVKGNLESASFVSNWIVVCSCDPCRRVRPDTSCQQPRYTEWMHWWLEAGNLNLPNVSGEGHMSSNVNLTLAWHWQAT